LAESRFRNPIVVDVDVAVKVVVNCSQFCVAVPAPAEFVKWPIEAPFTKTSTVLVVPKIPPGLTTFPSQNDSW